MLREDFNQAWDILWSIRNLKPEDYTGEKVRNNLILQQGFLLFLQKEMLVENLEEQLADICFLIFLIQGIRKKLKFNERELSEIDRLLKIYFPDVSTNGFQRAWEISKETMTRYSKYLIS